MSREAYVRILVPTGNNTGWGHYDLYIPGKVTIKGTTLSDAVFSYKADSKLYCFPESDTNNVYKESELGTFDMWRFAFEFDSTTTFENGMNSAIATYKKLEGTNIVVSTINSTNVFSNYSLEKINSFCAVAYWCKWLGYSTLINIYNNAHAGKLAYKRYLPIALKESHGNLWVETSMNGD